MDSVFQELKRAREAKRLSINDVSDATLINPGFLEAIEQGKTDILPQTYVRAFIREYASVVGLDPAEIMKHYDQTLAGVVTHTHPEQPSPPPPAQRETDAAPKAPSALESTQPTTAGAKYALPGILILILAIVIWNITRTKTPSETHEIPFESITKESTATVVPIPSLSQATTSPLDSLTLRATVNDSVWVEVIIDNLEPRQYMFRPNRKITWKAKDRFRISTGKAGAIDFMLNEKPLGILGKQGSARKVEINRQTLLQK